MCAQQPQLGWDSTQTRCYETVKADIVSRMFVRCASDRRGTLLSINRITEGEIFRGRLKIVRKTSVNRVL